MKKTLFTALLVFTLSLSFSSCKTDKKETQKKEIPETEMTNTTYQCPMDCENGKTYKQKGSCPVCKMDLKPVKNNEHTEHKH